jgi:hypothetical protein
VGGILNASGASWEFQFNTGSATTNRPDRRRLAARSPLRADVGLKDEKTGYIAKPE